MFASHCCCHIGFIGSMQHRPALVTMSFVQVFVGGMRDIYVSDAGEIIGRFQGYMYRFDRDAQYWRPMGDHEELEHEAGVSLKLL